MFIDTSLIIKYLRGVFQITSLIHAPSIKNVQQILLNSG